MSERKHEPFIVKHYIGEKYPCIKGNGFDGLRIAGTRDEVAIFVRYVNDHITALEAGLAIAQAEVEKILRNYAQLERHHNEHHDDIEAAEAWAVSTGAPASPTTTKE